jgi:arylsulfatase A-like enzyme
MQNSKKEFIYSIAPSYAANFSIFVAIWSICIALPLYQVLSAGVTFFAAHNAGPKALSLFVFLLSFAFPLTWAFVSTFAGIFSRKLRNILFAVGVAVPLAMFNAKAFLYQPWSWLPFWGVWILGILIMGLTAMITIRLVRWRPTWQGSTAGILVALVVAGLFIFSPSMVGFFFPKSSRLSVCGMINAANEKKPNIIILLFDELSLMEMLGAEDQINKKLFPNFSKLSKESIWFPHAYAVASQTHLNVPSIFTGILPSKDNLPPNRASHPNSLRNLLEQRGYNIYAKEECTNLFDSRIYRKNVFFRDLSIIFLNVMLPPAVISSMNIPSITHSWSDFFDDKKSEQNTDFKINEFLDFVNRKERFFAYYHFPIPHWPYKYLYNGALHNLGQFGFRDDGEFLPNDRDVINMVKMQYLQQACYADTVLGEVLEKMKLKKIYDDSVLIVLSDHGIVNEQGMRRKIYSADNISYDIACVPLFMRIPDEKNEIKSDLARHVDILPTLMHSLNWDIPWRTDGKSLWAEEMITDDDELIFYGAFMKGEYRIKREEFIMGYGDRIKQKKKIFSCDYQNAGEIYFSDDYLLSGTNVSDYQPIEPQENAAIIKNACFYKNLKLNGRILPVFLQVSLDIQQSLPMVFALNGKIYYVGRSFENNEKGGKKFIGYIPPAAFVEGYNKIELFVPVRINGELCLSPIKSDIPVVRLTDSGTIWYDQKEIKIQDEDIEGAASDMAKLEDGFLTLSGWAIDKKRISGVDMLLLFAGKDVVAFSRTTNLSRHDIAEGYKDSRFEHSGFSLVAANISEKDLPKLHLYAISGDIARELLLRGPLFGTDTNIGKKVKLKHIPVCSQDIVYAVDTKEVDESKVHLAGWAFLKDLDTRNQKVYIQMTNDRGKKWTYLALSVPRPDIVKGFNNKAYIRSGFDIIVPTNECEIKNLSVKIIIENEGLHETASFKIKQKGK